MGDCRPCLFSAFQARAFKNWLIVEPANVFNYVKPHSMSLPDWEAAGVGFFVFSDLELTPFAAYLTN